jgi:hypothetical protein
MAGNLTAIHYSHTFQRTPPPKTAAFKEFTTAEPVVLCDGLAGFTANTLLFPTCIDIVFIA